jgi:sensor histidine kinase YesM
MPSVVRTILICIGIGLSFGGYFYFTLDHRPIRLLISVLSSVCIGSLMMTAIWFRWYFTTLVRQQAVKVIIMIGLLVTAALLGSELTFIGTALLTPGEHYVPFRGGSIYILNILIALVVGIPLYVNEEGKGLLNSKLIEQQYRVLQLEQERTVAELELLRARINPHFLYNMHNTIAALIPTDPRKAEDLLLLLSRFFRFTLNKNSVSFHSLTDELDIITTYLNMQQIRYGHRMRYTIQADPLALPLPIPSFILQPIVENAIKHGIEVSSANGFVSIEIMLQQDTMLITIADSGPAFPESPGTGTGLQIVMNKLRLLYTHNFKLELNNPPQKYVRLTIPATH